MLAAQQKRETLDSSRASVEARRVKKLITPCLLVGILSCGGIEDTGQLARDDIENEVASFLESYLLALETRDLAVIHELYVDDGRFEWIEAHPTTSWRAWLRCRATPRSTRSMIDAKSPRSGTLEPGSLLGSGQ